MTLGTPTSSVPSLPMAKGCQPLPTALDVIADPGCHKRAPLQPRSHVFGTSKSQRAQRGCPCANPDVASLHVGAELVASCPHPTGSLEVKQASQVCRNSPDALVPIATCNPLPSSSLEPLQHPWGLLPQLLLKHRHGGMGWAVPCSPGKVSARFGKRKHAEI